MKFCGGSFNFKVLKFGFFACHALALDLGSVLTKYQLILIKVNKF